MERLVRHLLGLSVRFFERHTQGDLMQAVRQDVTELRTVAMALTRIVLEGVQAIGLIAAAVWLSPVLALWAFVVLPLATYPIHVIAQRTLARSFGVRRRGAALFDVILQLLQGIRIIKIYQGERPEADRATARARRYFDELIEMVRIRAMATVVLESLAGVSLVVVIILGGFQVMAGQLGWPALLAFLMAVRAAHGPLNAVNTSYIDLQRYGAAVARLQELLSERAEVVDRPDAEPLHDPPQTIAARRLGFSYNGTTLVLEEVSFELRSGETLGVVGPSGAGKSTLLNLLARLYDPTAGAVCFDGSDARDFRLADVYNMVALVTQDPFLFATTIRENIRCGRPDATDGEVEAAARAAEIHEDVLSMPDGYETVVGAGGRALSRGEAQRVNVARAIVKNAPILLLDEATSSLDSFSEARVQRALDRLMAGRTTVSVAHRLSTLRGATRILVLERGRVVGLDRHEALLHHCPAYRRLWEAQGHEARPQPPRTTPAGGTSDEAV
jgi:subfamily B ATP-binding cassette protein MsbA